MLISLHQVVLRLEFIFRRAFFSLTGSAVVLTKDKSAVAANSVLTFSWRHAVLRFKNFFNSAFFSLGGSAVVISKDKSAPAAGPSRLFPGVSWRCDLRLSVGGHFFRFSSLSNSILKINPQLALMLVTALSADLARPAGLEPATPGLAYQLPLSRPHICRFVVWTISSPSQAPHV